MNGQIIYDTVLKSGSDSMNCSRYVEFVDSNKLIVDFFYSWLYCTTIYFNHPFDKMTMRWNALS